MRDLSENHVAPCSAQIKNIFETYVLYQKYEGAEDGKQSLNYRSYLAFMVNIERLPLQPDDDVMPGTTFPSRSHGSRVV